jgi:hypothetical protein
MKKQRNHLAEDKQPRQPTAIFHLLPFLSPAVGPLAGKGAEALLKQIQSPDPVVVQVLDSKQVTNRHEVLFKVTNNTIHGIYIENASLLEPKDKHSIKRVDDPQSPGIDTPGGVESASAWSPVLVEPGDETFLELKFPLCQNRKMKTDWSGSMELVISRLDQQKEPQRDKVAFRIRWDDSGAD